MLQLVLSIPSGEYIRASCGECSWAAVPPWFPAKLVERSGASFLQLLQAYLLSSSIFGACSERAKRVEEFFSELGSDIRIIRLRLCSWFLWYRIEVVDARCIPLLPLIVFPANTRISLFLGNKLSINPLVLLLQRQTKTPPEGDAFEDICCSKKNYLDLLTHTSILAYYVLEVKRLYLKWGVDNSLFIWEWLWSVQGLVRSIFVLFFDRHVIIPFWY